MEQNIKAFIERMVCKHGDYNDNLTDSKHEFDSIDSSALSHCLSSDESDSEKSSSGEMMGLAEQLGFVTSVGSDSNYIPIRSPPQRERN